MSHHAASPAHRREPLLERARSQALPGKAARAKGARPQRKRSPGVSASSTFALLLCVALTWGCTSSVAPPLESTAPPSSAPRRGGTFHIATFTNLRSLDAAVAFDESASAIEQLLYAKLLDFSPDGHGFLPDLAERWEESADGRSYRFFLREGLVFHDGSPLTATDFKRSMERALSPETPCPVASFYARILGFDAFTHGKAPHLDGVIVQGERELEIRLSEPDATILSVLALPTVAPVCLSAGDKYDSGFSRVACGAGPFRLAHWESGAKVTLDRFEGYHDPSYAHVDHIEWMLNVPAFTQRLKFEEGELDYFRELSESDLRLYQSSAAWRGKGEWEPARTILSVFLNTEMRPFSNVELRRAFSAAINRDELARLRPGVVQPATRLIPPAIPGYTPTPGEHFDLAAALEHMRRAGYPFDPATGQGGYPEELTYIGLTDSYQTVVAQVMQQQLARIGIRFRIRALGWPAYLAETARRHRAALGNDGWSADFPDPSDFFEPILSTAAINDEDSQNRSFFSNPEFDELLRKARDERDWSKRMALYRQAEDIVYDQVPWVITGTYRYFELWQPYVRGYHVHPNLPEHVGGVWLDQPAAVRHAWSGLPGSLQELALALRGPP